MGSNAKYLELAVILSAVDNLSGTVNKALGGANGQFNQLANSQQKADAAMRRGLSLGAGAKVGIDMLSHLAKEYANVQEAQNDLRISTMKPGGSVDEALFSKYTDLAVNLSKKFGGTQESYYEMIRTMQENRLSGKDILGGIGLADAELSELFRTAPSEAALFTARMKNDMRVPADQMIQMIDLVARLKQVGVGHTGSETISNLTEFFSKAGLGASNMGLSGTKDATELGTLGAMFIAKGQDAPSVGTTFRRILDNISNPEKLKKMNEAAAEFGKHLVFFDEHGKFKGIQEMVAQLTTLHGMSVPDISKILGPLGSAQGMSGDVLKQISEFGKGDYEDFLKRVADQGTITDKVAEYQRGLNAQLAITGSNLDNLEASLGKSYNPLMTKAVVLTGELLNGLTGFVNNHQTLTAMGVGLVGIAAGAMAVGSAINFIGAAWTYSGVGKLFSWIGDSELWAAAEAGAEGFAMSLMTTVVPALEAVLAAAPELMALIALYEAWIHRDDLKSAAKREWESWKQEFNDAYDYIKYGKDDAGDRQKAQKKHDAEMAKKYSVSALTQNLKDAKRLHASAQQINGLKLNLSLAQALEDAKRKKNTYDLPFTGHNIHPAPVVNYSPNITIQGNADRKVLQDTLDRHKEEIARMLRDHQHNNNRTSY